MSQDLTDDLEICPGVDLAARMTVSKSMRSDHVCCDARFQCIVPDAVANRSAGYRRIGHILTQEKTTYAFGGWALPPQVCGQRSRDSR
jgi:hypothetical protein